jgi:hypothetical protein
MTALHGACQEAQRFMNKAGNDGKPSNELAESIDLKELTSLMSKLEPADRQLIIDFATTLLKIDITE